VLGCLLQLEALLLVEGARCFELLLELEDLSLSVFGLLLGFEEVLGPGALGRLSPLVAREVPQPDQLLVFLPDYRSQLGVVPA